MAKYKKGCHNQASVMGGGDWAGVRDIWPPPAQGAPPPWDLAAPPPPPPVPEAAAPWQNANNGNNHVIDVETVSFSELVAYLAVHPSLMKRAKALCKDSKRRSTNRASSRRYRLKRTQPKTKSH